ncbi:iron chelate uptake ABC transporter family permease subunit (plasmid) [Diaphorobacter sp. HDW4B]|uniref:iron chelate uptake ABC transporter family permease subunit n=1 Tax=Diaphorobacter sp. HDW4B TaxID=2714925 RepID=UPI00140D96EB|nr:iron chelate uptake ABC transporter family permease subunit [Diaphorobacter sp. HDW4B]QIL73786.1 iron chelate uptake ABC transporter family permease subunit [Diaphorobacter sp. HDW4B]
MRASTRWSVAMGLSLIVLAATFVLWGSGLDLDYVIPKRLVRLAAMVVGGICVAVSAIIFQTLVGNRILTPAIMGYEAIYLLWQSMQLLLLGTHGLAMLGVQGNFFVSIALMLGYSWLLNRWLLRRGRGDVYVLLLLGLVLTMVIGTFTQFVQLRISPGEFAVFQGLSYASFNRARPETLMYATLAVVAVSVVLCRTLPVLDVLALGRDQAISLGVPQPAYLRIHLASIAVLVAVSTSLIGPTAFMGIFVANIVFALAPGARHRQSLPLGSAVAIGIFLIAQLLVEHVFNYKTTVSILVNLVCGVYFLALILRARGNP